MRKIQFFALSAAAALALSMTTSCQKELEQAPASSSDTFTVTFSMDEMDTRTAMGEKDAADNITNVWSDDDDDRMTFYQNDIAATNVDIIINEDNHRFASFKATFEDATAESYTYKALLAANMVGDLPVVPAEQHPTDKSFDPNANVLVGLEAKGFTEQQTSVNLVYKHAAAISRISFSKIPDGLKIYGVQINASGPIAGVAKSVDYTTGDVNYSTASEKTISLIYNEAPSYSDGKFDAYFVAIPGAATITDIKLVTDKGTFVKTGSNGGVKTTFNVNNFKTLTVATPSTRTFYKATGFEDGINFMIVSGTRAMKVNSTNNVSSQTSVGSVANNSLSVTGETVINSISSLLWTAEASSTGFKLKSGSNYLIRSSSSSSSSYSLKGGSSTSSNNTFTYSNNYLMQGSRYAYYSNGWICNSTKTSVDIYTSKLPAPERTIAFAETSASVDIANGTSYTSPSLIGVDGAGVSYSSSDENIATIGSNGAITLNKKGTVTITATASFASTPIYQSSTATAFYELTVTNSNIKQFKKVTTPKSGGQYFIVSTDGYAMSYSSSKFSATQVTRQTTPEACIEIDVTKTMPTVWTFTSSGSNWKIASGSNQLRMNTSGSGSSRKYSISLVASTTTGDGLSWNYQNNHLSSQADSNSGHIGYISYSSSQFAAVSSSSSSATIELYEYVARDVYFSKGGQKITSDSYNIDSGAAYVSPTVAGEIDGATITYSTSDASIATVSSEGVVTINGNRKTGTVTITANVAKTSKYAAATISYTLKVIDPSYVKQYKKVTGDLMADHTYIIVSNNNAFKFALNTDKNAVVRSSDNAVAVTISSSDTINANLDDCEFVFTNIDTGTKKYSMLVLNGQYYFQLSRSATSSTTNQFAMTASDDDDSDPTGFRSMINNSSGNYTIQGNKGTYYLGYDTGKKYFVPLTATATVNIFELKND